MLISKNHIINRKDKKPISTDIYNPKTKYSKPIVIFCHGYKGFKDWGPWHLVAETIANSGFCFIKFNFSHNGGTIEQPIDFPDLEAFGNNNYTKELDDLNAIIDWVQSYFKTDDSIDDTKIYVIGHSRGGGIAILKASEDPRIKKLITLASISDFGKRTATIGDLKEWKEKGVKFVINGRTKQQMPHYYQFYEDFKANELRLNIEAAEKRLAVPHLIIHGDADTSIHINEAHELHQWNINSQLEIVEGADHVFNTKHPWTSDQLSKELKIVSNLIINFIKD